MRKNIRVPIRSEVAQTILARARIHEDVIDVRECYIGWNSLYTIITSNNEYIIKLFTNNFGNFGTTWKATKEEYIYTRLTRNTIHTPKIYLSDTSQSLVPYDYIVLEHIPGIELGRIDGAVHGKRRSDLSIPDYKNILKEAGKQTALNHKIEMPRLQA